MADTVRTKSALLTLFADNTSQNISAQDFRDLIVSTLGCYADIYITGGTNALTLAGSLEDYVSADTWVQRVVDDMSTTVGASVTGKITAGTDGIYLVIFRASAVVSSTDATTHTIALDTGTPATVASATTTSLAVDVCISALVDMDAGDDVYVRVNGTAADTLLYKEASLIAIRVA